MTIWVIGASGMVGSAFKRVLGSEAVCPSTQHFDEDSYRIEKGD